MEGEAEKSVVKNWKTQQKRRAMTGMKEVAKSR
jgi:hypothetical protein